MYTITFFDESGNFNSDMVIFAVEPTEDGNGDDAAPTISFGNYYLIFLLIGVASLTFIRKRKTL
ncbi:MAG: hypothetical protein ACFFG0_23775 [Candidatus Thorarchaeota archaeon]